MYAELQVVPSRAHLTFLDFDGATRHAVAIAIPVVVHVAVAPCGVGADLASREREEGAEKEQTKEPLHGGLLFHLTMMDGSGIDNENYHFSLVLSIPTC
ncbi:hypothetical protein EBT25_07495 [bacterium]|nr:hypothetical protein [bacterium]